MSLIWSVPVGVLLAAALFILLINRGSSNIGAAWFASIIAGLFVWGWTISLYFRPDIQIIPLADAVPGGLNQTGVLVPFEKGNYFVLDGISYPYMLAISALLVILLLTAPSYMEPQTAPRLWFFYLVIEAIGYLAVAANNVTFIIYGWVIFDAIDLVTQYIQARPGNIRRGFLNAVGVRFVGTLMAASTLALSDAEIGNGGATFISMKAGAYLFTACALRMGILPISQPYGEMSNSRVGLGTMLRLVSVLTVMPVLSRIPLGGLLPGARFFLGLAAVFASLAGAVGWLLSENSFIGISYAVLGISGMAFICALNEEQSALIVWGVSIALTCALLSLYQIRNSFMNLLVFIVVLCFSGLPYSPNAFGWEGLIRPPYGVHIIFYVLIPLFLTAGSFIHMLQTEGRKFSELEPWMRSVYPLGFVTAIGTHIFISMTGFDRMFSMGVMPASAAAFTGGMMLALSFLYMPESRKTQNTVAWGKAAMTFFWQGMEKLMNMDWLFTLLRWFSSALKKIASTVSLVLEQNGGLIWELLLLALLVAASFSGVVS